MMDDEGQKVSVELPEQDKVVLITGCANGMGLEIASVLAAMGATVVGAVRSPDQVGPTTAAIRARGGKEIEVLQADLQAQADVHNLAHTFRERHSRLDLLIHNASTYRSTRTLSPDGLEVTLAVNYLAPVLLTHLLLDTLRASAPARIITVSAASHRQGRIDFANLQGEHRYSFLRAAAQSKLALLMWTFALAERERTNGVTANAMHPGLMPRGAAARHMPPLMRLVMRVLAMLPLPFVRSAADGARTAIYLATSHEVDGVTGQYFVDCKPVRAAPQAYDRVVQQRLWAVSAELIGISAA